MLGQKLGKLRAWDS